MAQYLQKARMSEFSWKRKEKACWPQSVQFLYDSSWWPWPSTMPFRLKHVLTSLPLAPPCLPTLLCFEDSLSLHSWSNGQSLRRWRRMYYGFVASGKGWGSLKNRKTKTEKPKTERPNWDICPLFSSFVTTKEKNERRQKRKLRGCLFQSKGTQRTEPLKREMHPPGIWMLLS